MAQYRICPGVTFGLLTNEHQSLLVARYVPTKVIPLCNKDGAWFDDQCRRDFGHVGCIFITSTKH